MLSLLQHVVTMFAHVQTVSAFAQIIPHSDLCGSEYTATFKCGVASVRLRRRLNARECRGA